MCVDHNVVQFRVGEVPWTEALASCRDGCCDVGNAIKRKMNDRSTRDGLMKGTPKAFVHRAPCDGPPAPLPIMCCSCVLRQPFEIRVSPKRHFPCETDTMLCALHLRYASISLLVDSPAVAGSEV
jgi:hypothetical protein